MKINKSHMLTKREAEVLWQHINADISYGEGGSFNKEDEETGDFPFDSREAHIAKKALLKIKKYLTQ